MRLERMTLNAERHVTLTAYLQEVGGEFNHIKKRPAILVIPGGGYQYCSDKEADPVALAYLKAGFQAFVLRYSVRKDALWPNPLSDYEQAMELIRSKEDEWNLYQDKVAVAGFSAGGHLAGSAATMSKNRPNAAVLGYAALGEDIVSCNINAPVVTDAVDEKTCPCFVFSTRTDSVVPIANSTSFLNSLAKTGVAFESHIYGYGPHGFSTCDSSVKIQGDICDRVSRWVDDSIDWLKELFGDFADGCLGTPKCRTRINDNNQEVLSLDCTFGHLQQNQAAMNILGPLLQKLQQSSVKTQEGSPMTGKSSVTEMESTIDVAALMGRMTLRDMFNAGHVPAELLDNLEMQLGKIPNTK